MGAGIVQHRPPACCRWRKSEAEEAESCFGEDGGGHSYGGLDDERLKDVGEDVAAEQAEVGGSQGAGGFDELKTAGGHDLGADEAGVGDPSGESEGKDEVEKAGSEEGDEGDCEQDAGEREEGVGEVDVEDGVNPAAVEAGDGAENQTDGGGKRDDGQRDDHGDAGPIDGAGEDVSTELVGAKPMG